MKILYKLFLTNCNRLLTISLLVINISCKDFVDIDPPITEMVTETVFSDDRSAESAIIGIYSQMINDQTFFAAGGTASATYLLALSSDEFYFLDLDNQEGLEFSRNSLSPENRSVLSLWAKCYEYIYYANAALAGLENSKGVSQFVKNQLEGEAKFIRAFCYFYLVNMFGDVPLVTTIDINVNGSVTRSGQDVVYDHIIQDLRDAKKLLVEDYSYSNNERIRPNQFTASALLARVFFYRDDWDNSEAEATSVISNALYELESDVNDVFVANSSEAIWQLAPDGRNTQEAITFTIISASNLNQTLSAEMLNAFESEDARRGWIDTINLEGVDYFYPYKYKVPLSSSPPGIEYSMVLRLAEQYLIRAESRAQQNDIGGAQSDLNVIRNRAGLLNTTAVNQTDLLLAIEEERRVELFSEWGHRWLDLKRIGHADAVLPLVKGTNWQSTDVLYPIPSQEMRLNRNLTPQNSGY